MKSTEVLNPQRVSVLQGLSEIENSHIDARACILIKLICVTHARHVPAVVGRRGQLELAGSCTPAASR